MPMSLLLLASVALTNRRLTFQTNPPAEHECVFIVNEKKLMLSHFASLGPRVAMPRWYFYTSDLANLPIYLEEEKSKSNWKHRLIPWKERQIQWNFEHRG